MEDWDSASFFKIHADTPREGPGETADVAWAAEIAGLAPDARVLDAASGPGGDMGALLRAAPDGHVTALDKHGHFIDSVRARWGHDKRVTLKTGDYLELEGTFDFIWCAGAVYFVGIEAALTAWAPHLAPGGAVAFSEPCLFTDMPSDGAIAFWDGYARLTDADGIADHVRAAGFDTRATRKVSDIGWETYYRGIEDRIKTLRPGADAGLLRMIEREEREIADWRAHKSETGYLLSVVTPRS
ncbi:class I SAM-dependent methyltransferase [Gymnodinialimonas sp. 2305UL16-5]|uniref:SAM-dependent methyltransferase n=1 Tax=Gymnodinialimonas mytili TaxID=3126503 RepID=UPI0030B253B6